MGGVTSRALKGEKRAPSSCMQYILITGEKDSIRLDPPPFMSLPGWLKHSTVSQSLHHCF